MASENDPQAGADFDLDGAIAALRITEAILPERAIRELQQHREQAIPPLIEALEQATAQVREGETPEDDAHFFALFLLTEFQAKEALPALLEAITLPDNLPGQLFGDAITAFLDRALATLAGDRPDVMDELIAKDDLNEFVRWAAASSFLGLVYGGQMSRDDAVRRLHVHLREAIQREDERIAGPLVNCLSYLRPQEAYDDIVKAFKLDLVDPFLIRLKHVDQSIAERPEQTARHLEKLYPGGLRADTVEELRTWHAFREPEPPKPEPPKPKRNVQNVVPTSRPATAASPVSRTESRIGRNDPCPCGSGKKHKKCCGRLQ